MTQAEVQCESCVKAKGGVHDSGGEYSERLREFREMTW